MQWHSKISYQVTSTVPSKHSSLQGGTGDRWYLAFKGLSFHTYKIDLLGIDEYFWNLFYLQFTVISAFYILIQYFNINSQHTNRGKVHKIQLSACQNTIRFYFIFLYFWMLVLIHSIYFMNSLGNTGLDYFWGLFKA